MNSRSTNNGQKNIRFKQLSATMLGIFVALIFISISLFGFKEGEKQKTMLFHHPMITLSDGFLKDNEPITLPYKLKDTESGSFTLTTQISTNGLLSPYLYIKAKYFNFKIYIDGQYIDALYSGPEGGGKPYGKKYIFLPLPSDSALHTLTLSADFILDNPKGYDFSAPIIGEKSQIIFETLKKELPKLCMISIIFCFGLFLLLFTIQSNVRGHSTTFLHTGIFAAVFAAYSITITESIHFFVPNSYFIYICEFLLLAILPMPLLALVMKTCHTQCLRLLKNAYILTVLNFFLQIYCQFLTPFTFRQTVYLTHICMVISAIVLFLAVFCNSRHEKDYWQLVISFFPIFIGTFWDIIQFYLPHIATKATGFQAGVLLFMILQTAYLIQSYFNYHENYLQANVYRQIAYTDALTGIGNRAAFEEKILELQNALGNYQSIWCISADVNDLKYVNDHLGHAKGDELIRGAASVLKDVSYQQDSLYRTGGDEFVLFLTDISDEEMAGWRSYFDEALNKYNQLHENKLFIAAGYDSLRKNGHDTIHDLISRTDRIMYEEKNRMKNHSPISADKRKDMLTPKQ